MPLAAYTRRCFQQDDTSISDVNVDVKKALTQKLVLHLQGGKN